MENVPVLTSATMLETAICQREVGGALACSVIFGAAPLELFPAFHFDIEQSVLKRANELYQELQGDPSKSTRIKLDFLEALLARLEGKRADGV